MRKKLMKKIMIAVMLTALIIGAVPTGEAQAASKLRLNATKLSLKVGQSKQLKVRKKVKKVKWSSSKKSVVTVSKNGKIKAKKAGKATVYAKIGKTRLKCRVVVKNKEKTSKKSSSEKKVLVVYFSATGSTERVAKVIKNTAKADIYEIRPRKPYTDADLDWTDDASRVNKEHDSGTEPEISGTVSNIKKYDVVYLGYPIWWGIAAWPLDGFVKANDFTGKTVIPFCTSSASDLGDSGKLLADMAGTGEWQEGQRFQSSASEGEVQKWVNGLGILK